MIRAVVSFRGEAPRVTPRALPDNAAQEALNASLLTGDLRAFKQFSTTFGTSNGGVVQTIFLLSDKWLSWTADVDVTRGAIAGDTTFRTYLTSPGFYAEPRFTNYAMATTGAPPYPVTTRPLGVPGPNAAPGVVMGVTVDNLEVDVLDDGGELNTSWVRSTAVNSGGVHSDILEFPGIAAGFGYLVIYNNNAGSATYMYRNFGISKMVAVTVSFDFYFPSNPGGGFSQAIMHVLNSIAGDGLTVAITTNPGPIQLCAASGWSSIGQSVLASSSSVALSLDTWYTMRVNATLNVAGTITATASLYQGSVQMETVTTTNVFTVGDYCGIVGETSAIGTPADYATYYNNILVQGNGVSTSTAVATSYVYTFVNDLGEESAPSPVSSTVLRPDGVTATVTTPVAVPSGVSSDYGITTKRIYRAATGVTGTAFLFVAEIALATADYDDVLTDAELGEVLRSDLWALPPDDLEGVLALPNGVMAGFAKNQLCLSAINQPHAWPVEYRLNTDTDIIGIGNIDTTVVIGTESFVYIASGNDPAAYSMSKFEVPYACTSKRSFAYLTGIGVVFASPDGLMAVQGPGQVRNLTDSVFTRDQWQALDPTSIRGVAHNDIYWMFWQAGSVRGCYAIDMKATGFGVVQMAFHASAAYADPIEDKLYMTLDQDDEPDDVLLPIPADPPNYVDGSTIYQFEGNQAVRMNYRWRSKLWLLEHPSWFIIAQVKGEDFDNLLLRVYGNGVQIEEIVVSDGDEFTLSVADEYNTLQYELLGTSTVRVVQGAEDISELG